MFLAEGAIVCGAVRIGADSSVWFHAVIRGDSDAVEIGRRTISVARQSIWWGLALSGVAMLVAGAGYLPPVIGALVQEGIDVAVILNALRTSRA